MLMDLYWGSYRVRIRKLHSNIVKYIEKAKLFSKNSLNTLTKKVMIISGKIKKTTKKTHTRYGL